MVRSFNRSSRLDRLNEQTFSISISKRYIDNVICQWPLRLRGCFENKNLMIYKSCLLLQQSLWKRCIPSAGDTFLATSLSLLLCRHLPVFSSQPNQHKRFSKTRLNVHWFLECWSHECKQMTVSSLMGQILGKTWQAWLNLSLKRLNERLHHSLYVIKSATGEAKKDALPDSQHM